VSINISAAPIVCCKLYSICLSLGFCGQKQKETSPPPLVQIEFLWSFDPFKSSAIHRRENEVKSWKENWQRRWLQIRLIEFVWQVSGVPPPSVGGYTHNAIKMARGMSKKRSIDAPRLQALPQRKQGGNNQKERRQTGV
jgi:hypothetical protein